MDVSPVVSTGSFGIRDQALLQHRTIDYIDYKDQLIILTIIKTQPYMIYILCYVCYISKVARVLSAGHEGSCAKAAGRPHQAAFER